jgi:hypothetical protein
MQGTEVEYSKNREHLELEEGAAGTYIAEWLY